MRTSSLIRMRQELYRDMNQMQITEEHISYQAYMNHISMLTREIQQNFKQGKEVQE